MIPAGTNHIPLEKVAIIVPALNAATTWTSFRDALLAQGVAPSQVLIVDSTSTDDTVALAKASGFRVAIIPRSDFNHGGTRQWAVQFFPEAELLVYLTQDAILDGSSAICELVAAFADPSVGAAYGRQLPRPKAGPIESHARLFNYAGVSDIRSYASRERLGFKAIFISNSFAAYRQTALEAAGGFPAGVIFGEDTITAARLLMQGWQVAYVATATVYHSHEYSIAEEFRRYFDIGVLHTRESWLRREFGAASSEGKRFVLSELKYLWPRHATLIPSAILRTLAKFAGYRLGGKEASLSPVLKRRMSMHRHFWK